MFSGAYGFCSADRADENSIKILAKIIV